MRRSSAVAVGSNEYVTSDGRRLGTRSCHPGDGAERCVAARVPRALPVRMALCARLALAPARHCSPVLSRAGEVACRPEAPPALGVRVSVLTFPGIPDLHSHFPVAGKRRSADENAVQGTSKTIKSSAALDDLYPYKATCTATRDGGFAPAWELALYALIFLAQDVVRRTIGKRARGADTASTTCPFADALRAASINEKVHRDADGGIAVGCTGIAVGCKWSAVLVVWYGSDGADIQTMCRMGQTFRLWVGWGRHSDYGSDGAV